MTVTTPTPTSAPEDLFAVRERRDQRIEAARSLFNREVAAANRELADAIRAALHRSGREHGSVVRIQESTGLTRARVSQLLREHP